MSDYNKATNFAVKDGYTTGNPNKAVKGTELDDEFNAISSAISSKADIASPTFTGTPAAPTASAGTNTTQIANTAFVTDAISDNNTTERAATATLTNKTLTSPVISGGTINNAVIGGTTAAAGTFTTATATTVALPSNWTVIVSSGKLVFQVSGVTKASLDSSGNLIVTGNITAYGTP